MKIHGSTKMSNTSVSCIAPHCKSPQSLYFLGLYFWINNEKQMPLHLHHALNYWAHFSSGNLEN